METPTVTTATVGRFTFDTSTGQMSGPAEYMRSAAYSGWKARLEAGGDVVVNFGMREAGANFITLMLVSVQTDFAGWLGLRTLGRDGRS